MQCEKCANSYRSKHDRMLECDVLSCTNGSEFMPIDIPVSWIREQIAKNPGRHASSWNYLLEIWSKHVLYGDQTGEKKTEDKYIRMHQDMTAAQKFWRNE